MGLHRQQIERDRETPRGVIPYQDDLLWEAYLQVHTNAERLGLLSRDSEVHDLLNSRLANFEERYSAYEVHYVMEKADGCT